MRKVYGLLIIICILGILAACALMPSNHFAIKFIGKPCITPYDKYVYRTCSDLVVKIDDDFVVIPENFMTDIASIPRWYWPIIAPPHSTLMAPGILHDFLYHCALGKTRKYADEVFYSALEESGVTHFTALKFFIAVRLFGSNYFHPAIDCLTIRDKDEIALLRTLERQEEMIGDYS